MIFYWRLWKTEGPEGYYITFKTTDISPDHCTQQNYQLQLKKKCTKSQEKQIEANQPSGMILKGKLN